MMYYRLTDETIKVGDQTLHRIQATHDLPQHGVKAGDKGGYIRSYGNLQGRAWVSDEAKVMDGAYVSGNAYVGGEAKVMDSAYILDNAQVGDQALVSQEALVKGDAIVMEQAGIEGNAIVTRSATVSGNALVSGEALVAGRSHVTGSATISGEAYVTDSSIVKGPVILMDESITGNAVIDNDLDVMTTEVFTTTDLAVTLTRQNSEAGHLLMVGCWRGTVDELEEMIERDFWVETRGKEATDKARPEMKALINLVRKRIALW